MSTAGDVNVFQWSWNAEFDSWFNVMATRNHFVLHQHPELSLKALLILPENLCDILEKVCPVSRWMFSSPELLQTALLFHLRPGICNSHEFGALSPLLHEVFLRGFPMRSSSFGKCVSILCFPCTSFRFSLNSCNQTGNSDNGSSRDSRLSTC